MRPPSLPRAPTRWDWLLGIFCALVLGGRALFGEAEVSTILQLPQAAGAVLAALTALLAAAAVVLRRPAPLPMLAVATGVAIAWSLAGFPGPGAALAPCMVLYAVALTRPLRTTVIAGSLAAVALTSATVLVPTVPDEGPPFVVPALMLALAVAIGLWQRSLRDLRTAYEERIGHSEASREDEARRRVAEDRLRIARDLHDVIAHHIAVVNVQSAAAEQLLRTDPDQATASLRHVRGAARTVLTELGTVLDVLRAGGAPVAPTADGTLPLSGLDQLADGFRAGGAEVRIDRRRADLLGDDVELVAYRVVQEALTNACKHAPGSPVSVSITGEDQVVIRVENGPAAGPGPASGGSGHGLTGMRERVHSIGGTLHTGPTGAGGYVVEASIPLARHELSGNPG